MLWSCKHQKAKCSNSFHNLKRKRILISSPSLIWTCTAVSNQGSLLSHWAICSADCALWSRLGLDAKSFFTLPDHSHPAWLQWSCYDGKVDYKQETWFWFDSIRISKPGGSAAEWCQWKTGDLTCMQRLQSTLETWNECIQLSKKVVKSETLRKLH